jgi:hypothetical protein
VDPRLDLDALDDDAPFEIDDQAAHLFKHATLASTTSTTSGDPTRCSTPPNPRPTGLMVAEVAGNVLVVPIAPPDSGDPSRCRPIGCYPAAQHLVDRYREDR